MKETKTDKAFAFTSLRINQRTRELHMRNMSLASVVDMMKRESKRKALDRFRSLTPILEGLEGRMEFNIQRFSVAASFRKDGEEGWRFVSYNGLVLLSVGQLPGIDEAQTVKRLAALHPSTLAAFVGSSGRTAKILVRVSRTDGSLPQTEGEAMAFHRKAYMQAYATYEGTLNHPITRVDPTLEQNFVRTYDAQPYVNPKAAPLRVDETLQVIVKQRDETPIPQQPMEHAEPGLERYADLEKRFMALITKLMLSEPTRRLSDSDPEAFLSKLARECCRTGYPQEEAIRHAINDFGHVANAEALRSLFESAYQLEAANFGTKQGFNKTQRTAMMLRDFMQSRYVLRHNVIQGTTEYRENTTWDSHFHLLDDRMLGKMVVEARLRGIDVLDPDMRRYVTSADIPSFDPVESFLSGVRGQWDGVDRIATLAETVKTRNPMWGTWFRRWFLSMVAQWMGVMGQYGNSVAPLLIGRQGWRKSTFCRQLLPDELQFGYTDQLDFSSKKEVDRTICQYLLVNLDEFDQLSRRNQDGYLKNLLQRADIRTRVPYKSQVATMRRYASFIGTSNQSDLLTDPSGSRRFLCVELTGAIDVTSRPNYRQLYAQAVQLVEQGERYWFDDKDVEEIMANNRRYMNMGVAEMTFHDLFRPAQPDEPGSEWVSSTALLEEIRSHVGSRTTLSAITFGRYLNALPGMQTKRSAQGNKFCIKRL